MDEIISYKMCAVKVRNAKLRNYLNRDLTINLGRQRDGNGYQYNRSSKRIEKLQYMNNLDIVLALFTTPNHRFSRLDTTAAFQAATSATSNWVQENSS
jgi:hypothetical protein